MSSSCSSSLSPRKPVAYQGMWTTPAISGPDLCADGARPVLGLAQPLLGRTDEDRDLAEVLVLVEELVGLGDVLEGHRLPQHRAHLAGRHEVLGLQALPRVGEVRADDLLLAHPQVADVEVEVVARRRAADDDLAERLDAEHARGERRPADVLEDDVRRLAEELLDPLGERTRDLEARLLLLGRLVARAHHPRDLAAVDVVLRAQALDEL